MHLRSSLIIKLTLAFSLILIGFMGLLDFININNFRKVMIGYTVSNADQLAEIINQSAYDYMLKNDKDSLYEMVRRISLSEGIHNIRLMDRTGKIMYSSLKEEIGTIVDKNAEACNMCHKSGDPRQNAPSMHRSRFFTNKDGMELMGLTKAIYNQPACFTASCHFHSQDYSILGVLDITVSLKDLHQKTRDYRMQFVVITCIFILIIGILTTLLIQSLVNKPVQRLVKHMSLVSEGNLEARVKVLSQDELGVLSESVNRMTENLMLARAELTEWASSLEMKVDDRTKEIKKIEGQLLRSEKLASLGKLVAGIAHEINNPLTGILLYSSIINGDKRLHPELKPDIDRVIAESKRCTDIVSRLLEFSREAMPHKESVSLNDLLDKVINLIHKQPTFQDISILKVYAPNLPDTIIDPSQIQQVFINIFLNASHAMEENGELTVTTYRDAKNSMVGVRIKDTGCGISEEDIDKIFDPFFTTKQSGTGLGLSISYGIVENNGGTIKVSSRVGIGTTFTLLLPEHNTSRQSSQITEDQRSI